MSEHVIARKVYVLIWVALMVLTVITVLASTVDLGQFSAPVALFIASVKALLVVLFFMHVRYASQKMVWVVIIAGVFWLGILLALTVGDYVTRALLPFPGR